jgi:hypothetical protein
VKASQMIPFDEECATGHGKDDFMEFGKAA